MEPGSRCVLQGFREELSYNGKQVIVVGCIKSKSLYHVKPATTSTFLPALFSVKESHLQPHNSIRSSSSHVKRKKRRSSGKSHSLGESLSDLRVVRNQDHPGLIYQGKSVTESRPGGGDDETAVQPEFHYPCQNPNDDDATIFSEMSESVQSFNHSKRSFRTSGSKGKQSRNSELSPGCLIDVGQNIEIPQDSCLSSDRSSISGGESSGDIDSIMSKHTQNSIQNSALFGGGDDDAASISTFGSSVAASLYGGASAHSRTGMSRHFLGPNDSSRLSESDSSLHRRSVKDDAPLGDLSTRSKSSRRSNGKRSSSTHSRRVGVPHIDNMVRDPYHQHRSERDNEASTRSLNQSMSNLIAKRRQGYSDLPADQETPPRRSERVTRSKSCDDFCMSSLLASSLRGVHRSRQNQPLSKSEHISKNSGLSELDENRRRASAFFDTLLEPEEEESKTKVEPVVNGNRTLCLDALSSESKGTERRSKSDHLPTLKKCTGLVETRKSSPAPLSGSKKAKVLPLESRAVLKEPHWLAGELVTIVKYSKTRDSYLVHLLGKDPRRRLKRRNERIERKKQKEQDDGKSSMSRGEQNRSRSSLDSSKGKLTRLPPIPASQLEAALPSALWASLKIQGKTVRAPVSCRVTRLENESRDLSLRVKLDTFPGLSKVIPVAKVVLYDKKCDWSKPRDALNTLRKSPSRKLTTKLPPEKAKFLNNNEVAINPDKQPAMLAALVDYQLVGRTYKAIEGPDGEKLAIYRIYFPIEKKEAESRKAKKSDRRTRGQRMRTQSMDY